MKRRLLHDSQLLQCCAEKWRWFWNCPPVYLTVEFALPGSFYAGPEKGECAGSYRPAAFWLVAEGNGCVASVQLQFSSLGGGGGRGVATVRSFGSV
jgi:hypothetical protein